jgi:hypothetical protein
MARRVKPMFWWLHKAQLLEMTSEKALHQRNGCSLVSFAPGSASTLCLFSYLYFPVTLAQLALWNGLRGCFL